MPGVRAAHTHHVLATKLCVVIHNLAHQLFDQLLADCAVLTASQFRYRLRDTSPVSTLSDLPVIAGYSSKKSSISSTIMQ